jgi:hypothetical protein
MKQFFVFIHSNFSEPSLKCEAIIKTLPAELNVNYLCVDNRETREIIQNDPNLEIRLVPCLLIVNTEGRITKYEGKKCYEYLSQYRIPQKTSEYYPVQQQQPQPPQPQTPPPIQQQQQAPQAKPQTQQAPQPQPKPKPQQASPPPPPPPTPPAPPTQHIILDDNDDSFNNPPDLNQTSSILLSENDDDDEEGDTSLLLQHQQQQHLPLPPPQQQQQQQAVKPVNKGKPSLLAQATAMQKSRLLEEEIHKKK